MFGLGKFLNKLPSWMKVSFIIGGLGNVMDLWHEADARERGILLLVFAPMFLSLGGLLFSIASFVLFVLPAFILRLLGWGILSALFGAGGRYCYAHITGRANTNGANSSAPAYTDVEFREAKRETKDDGEGRRVRRSNRAKQVEIVDEAAEDDEPDEEQADPEGQGGGRVADDLDAIRQRWTERVKGKR